MNTQPMNNVTRIEVIDGTGRAYIKYLEDDERIRYSFQDDNRTLKIFIDADTTNVVEGDDEQLLLPL